MDNADAATAVVVVATAVIVVVVAVVGAAAGGAATAMALVFSLSISLSIPLSIQLSLVLRGGPSEAPDSFELHEQHEEGEDEDVCTTVSMMCHEPSSSAPFS